MLRNQRAYQFIYDWTKNRCAAAVGAWGGRMVGRAAVGLLGCLKKEQMSENALLQAAEAAKKCYLRPAADTDDWQALQPFGQTEVLVSVIVPVHNGEKDLRQCLNSILAQECGNTVEIIAVNDNSTDSSGDILEEYANWGEVRRVELTKETGGSAAKARNAGILQAKGEYLLFVDCDDVLLPGAISALLQKAQQTGADIVQGGWQYLDGDGKFARSRAFSAPFHCAPMPASYGCAWLQYCSGSSGLPHRYHDNAPAFHRYPPASWQLPVHIPARCHARPSEFPPDKLLPPYGLYFASYSAPFFCCSFL